MDVIFGFILLICFPQIQLSTAKCATATSMKQPIDSGKKAARKQKAITEEREGHLTLLKRVYSVSSEEEVSILLRKLSAKSSENQSGRDNHKVSIEESNQRITEEKEPSLFQCLTDARYRGSTWNAIMLSLFR